MLQQLTGFNRACYQPIPWMSLVDIFITHACSISEPRERRMTHARIILENGRSVLMDKLAVGGQALW